MLSCKQYNRMADLSPYYYHVALHRIPKDDFYNEKQSHETIKRLIDLFVLEYKKMHRDYDRVARIIHMIKTCCTDYRLRYRCKFRYNDILSP